MLIPLYVVLALLVWIAAADREDAMPGPRCAAWPCWPRILAAPFLGGLGSNNPLWFSAALNPGFWIAGALAMCALADRVNGRLLVHGLAFAFATLIAFTAFDGTWHHPYRQSPLAADTVGVGLTGPLNGLSTDPYLASFLNQVRGLAEPVLASRPNVVVWTPGLPGASVATGLSQPLFAWLSADYFAQRSLAAACADHSRGILLLQSPNQPAPLTTDPVLAAACGGRSWAQRGLHQPGHAADRRQPSVGPRRPGTPRRSRRATRSGAKRCSGRAREEVDARRPSPSARAARRARGERRAGPPAATRSGTSA